MERVSEIKEGKSGDRKICGGVVFEKYGSSWRPDGLDSSYTEIEERGPTLFGRAGSKWFILGPEGERISTGYQHIYDKYPPFSAKTGSRRVTLEEYDGVYVPNAREDCLHYLDSNYYVEQVPDKVIDALKAQV